MAIPVRFGSLTYATKPITTDIIDIYKKNLKKLKDEYNTSSTAKPTSNPKEDVEIKESLEKEKAKSENYRFGALTGIKEDYYRPAEKVTNRLEYAQTEDDKEESKSEIKVSSKDLSAELEEFNKCLENAEANCN